MLRILGLGVIGLAAGSVLQTVHVQQPDVVDATGGNGSPPVPDTGYSGAGPFWVGDGAARAETPAGSIGRALSPRIAILPAGGVPVGRNVQISGLPGYGRMAFLLPMGHRVTEASLVLPYVSEIPDTVNAILRVSVNGQRRHEVLLAAGRERRELVLPLLARDLARNTVQISFAVTGVSTTGLCSTDIGNALVTLAPEARLDALTARPLVLPDDRYRAAGGVAGLAWPKDGTDESKAKLLMLAAQAIRAGLEIELRPTGAEPGGFMATPGDLAAMLAGPGSWNGPSMRREWPLALTDGETGGASLRTFTGSHSWRHGFTADDLPDGRLPATLDYGLRLGPLIPAGPAPRQMPDGAGQGWLVHVTLNGSLIEAFTTTEGELRRRAALPPELLRHGNQIEITVGRSFGVEGVCNDGPPLIAELAADSVLLPGVGRVRGISAQLADLVGDSAAFDPAGVSALTIPEAQAAARLLADLPAMPKEGAGGASVSILRLADLPDPDTALRQEGWVYLREDNGPRLVALSDQPGLRQISDHALGLLIGPAQDAPEAPPEAGDRTDGEGP